MFLFVKMKKSYACLITSSPSDTLATQDAIVLIKQLLENGNLIDHVFFYCEGVHHANHLNKPLGDEFNANQAWAALANEYNIPMLVCVTSALRRGVVDSETATQEGLSQHNLAVPFQQVGLGEFFTRLHSVDNLVQL